MRTIFLAGGIGSGKSTVARELELRGATRIDLDQLSREVLEPGSPATLAVTKAFGGDLIDKDSGELNRALLAQRAFASPESTARLEAIELPFIADLLCKRLAELGGTTEADALCVVEVPLLDRAMGMRELADEIVLVDCPMALRRVRAIGRGMQGEDFDARAAQQPDDVWLRAHADYILDNSGDTAHMLEQLDAWLSTQERGGER